jgi:beta-phosphoglucomutase-like phosphatase (HAD superfamily)
VFEDSTSGVAAGRAAGCTVVATLFTHPTDDLHAADYIVPDLTGIKPQAHASHIELHIVPNGR